MKDFEIGWVNEEGVICVGIFFSCAAAGAPRVLGRQGSGEVRHREREVLPHSPPPLSTMNLTIDITVAMKCESTIPLNPFKILNHALSSAGRRLRGCLRRIERRRPGHGNGEGPFRAVAQPAGVGRVRSSEEYSAYINLTPLSPPKGNGQH